MPIRGNPLANRHQAINAVAAAGAEFCMFPLAEDHLVNVRLRPPLLPVILRTIEERVECEKSAELRNGFCRQNACIDSQLSPFVLSIVNWEPSNFFLSD